MEIDDWTLKWFMLLLDCISAGEYLFKKNHPCLELALSKVLITSF